MIKILKYYYDKDGKRGIVLNYSGGVYLCDFGGNDKRYLKSNELFEKKKTKSNKIKKVSSFVEPVYKNVSVKKTKIVAKNSEENKESKKIVDTVSQTKSVPAENEKIKDSNKEEYDYY